MKKKKVGRPRKYETPEQMQPMIDKYFKYCDTNEKPFTVAGLASYLGFASRTAPWEYSHDYPEFSNTIKKAMLKIETQRSEMLLDGKNPAGKIFDLVNNFGWENPQKIKHSADIDNISELLNNIAGALRVYIWQHK